MPPEYASRIAAHYVFSESDKAALTNLLAGDYLHAKVQAYQRAYKTAGSRVSFPIWQPTKQEVEKASAWATPMTESIAETFETLLRSQLEQMEPEASEGLGDLWRGVKNIVQKVGDWITGFLGWKIEQIADNTLNGGDNDGTEQFIEDVIASGDDYSMMRVRVVPSESSSDYCKDYAGRDFAFDAVGTDVPEFPTHANCIHYLEIYVVDDSAV